MGTHRIAKWRQEASDIFKYAANNSLNLYLCISYACASQSGEGFEELVNAINENDTKKKIKKITLVDTSYLYRHCIKEFAQYSDPTIETEWFLKNKEFIAKIECPLEMESWAQGITGEKYQYWEKKIMHDFAGDENGNGILQEFRDSVMQEAAVATYKRNYTIDGCINFILEECAHACAHLKDALIIYPSTMPNSFMACRTRYNLGFRFLRYNVSKQSRKHNVEYNLDTVNKAIVSFMQETVTNVNFFVIDKYGNHIYKNYAYDNIVGNMNAISCDPKAWEISKEVMKTKKQIIIEEKGRNDRHYLSIKAPLIINNTVEGVIGLAIDITERKKAEMLELQNKLQQIYIQDQEEFQTFAARMAHDIMSPLIALRHIVKSSMNIPENTHIALREIASSIQNIANTLLERYETDVKQLDTQQEQYILVQLAVMDILEQKKYQYKDANITFHHSFDEKTKFTFIKGDQTNFSRMLSNLINNAAEAINNKHGIINLSTTVEDNNIKITIRDNGIGMPQNIVNKIKNHEKIKTNKKSGYGIGIGQVLDTIKLYNGTFDVISQEGVGTTFTIKFPTSEKPKWMAEKIAFHKGDTIVILDDDLSIFNIWKEIFKKYENIINVQYFTNEKEANKFFNSLSTRDNIYLISDFELRNQRKNGLMVILENKMRDKALLVTSIHNNNKIYNIAEQSGIQIMQKQFLNDIPILIS